MTSADLIAELQRALPTAETALRERVRELAASAPPPRPSPFERLSRLSLRRFALVAVPATAVVLIGLAGGIGLLDPASKPGVTSSRQSLELTRRRATAAARRAQWLRSRRWEPPQMPLPPPRRQAGPSATRPS